MKDLQIADAFRAQRAAITGLRRKKLLFKLQLQQWYRLHKDRNLVVQIDINTDGQRIGLFAELTWLLYCVAYVETIGGRPVIRITSTNYSPADDGRVDYLASYFQLQWPDFDPSKEWLIEFPLSSVAQLPHFEARTKEYNLWRANGCAAKYLIPRSDIQCLVDSVVVNDLANDFIAVHWRGTDKFLEADPVQARNIVDILEKVVPTLNPPPKSIYLASDEEELILALKQEIKSRLPWIRSVSRQAISRSTDGTPLHLQPGLTGEQRVQLGKEALIDCLIMARSRALVRTSSFLSAWCLIWNPVLPVYMVNSPKPGRTWFPDTEVLEASRFHFRSLKGI